jgi:hypothetical protein
MPVIDDDTTRRTAHDLTLTQMDKLTREKSEIPLPPGTLLSLEGRGHQLLIDVNKHGEILLHLKRRGEDRMLVIAHFDELSLYLLDADLKDVGHFVMKETGEIECSICQRRDP